MALSYEKIFSRVRNKINDPKELALNEEDLLEINKERLHSAAGNVRIRRMFSTLAFNDEIEEMTWTMANTITGSSAEEEEDFVMELFSLAMVIEWLRPQVESTTYINMSIGGKEEKKLNDAHKINVERLDSLEVKLSFPFGYNV